MKIYNEKLKYYKSEDLLDIFIRVFKDLCLKVSVGLEEYRNAFSIIFTSEANEFYYQKLAKKNFSFDKMIKIIKSNTQLVEYDYFYYGIILEPR